MLKTMYGYGVLKVLVAKRYISCILQIMTLENVFFLANSQYLKCSIFVLHNAKLPEQRLCSYQEMLEREFEVLQNSTLNTGYASIR